MTQYRRCLGTRLHQIGTFLKLAPVSFKKRCRRYFADQQGTTAIEYAMIATGIGLALVLIFAAIGDELVNVFSSVESRLEAEARDG